MATMHGMMKSHGSHLDELWTALGHTNVIVEVAEGSLEIHLKRNAIACLSFSLRNRDSAGSAVAMLGRAFFILPRECSHFRSFFDCITSHRST